MVTDLSKSNRWLKVIISYQNKDVLEPCPFCRGKLTVEELMIGRGSVTFQCQSCGKMAHFDCKIRKKL